MNFDPHIIKISETPEKVVFDVHTYSLIVAGLVYALISTAAYVCNYYSLMGEFEITTRWLVNNQLTVALLGAILGFVVMELISRSGYLLAGTRAFGEGDSYIAAGLVAVFGWRILVDILVMSAVIQLLVVVPMFIKSEFTKKNYKTLIYLAIFIALAVGFFTLQYFGYMSKMLVYIPSTLLLIVIGALLCKEILVGVKNNPSERTYLPYGPALVIAGFIVLLV